MRVRVRGKQADDEDAPFEYGRIADLYDTWFRLMGFKRGLEQFLDRIDWRLPAGARVLDAGAGTGFLALWVLARFPDAEVIAFDIDRQMLAVLGRSARRLGESRRRLTVAQGDLRDNETVVLHVGRLAPEKNAPLAVEAYRAMQRTVGAVRCVIVGDGPQRSELEKAHPDVIFCGMRTGEALAAHYASADVFLFPSETETFGNVTLEALASGLAVVAYDYAAAGIHIDGGRSGVLVPRGDSRAFIEAAATLGARPELLPEMRRVARAHALDLDWASVVQRFEALLTWARVEHVGAAVAPDAAAVP